MTGLENTPTDVLMTLRVNLLNGMNKAEAHLEAGTFDTAPNDKAVPPREAAHLTHWLLTLVQAELDTRPINVFYIEVDVALDRPPTPENIVTTYHVVASSKGQIDAELAAISTACHTRKIVMPTATRVTCVEE